MASRRLRKKIAKRKQQLESSKQKVSQLTYKEQNQQNYNYDGLNEIKADLRGIISEANWRIEQIEYSGLESYALEKFHQENPGKRNFSINDLDSYEDIIAEATKASVFISDRTSMLEGAELYSQQLSYLEYLGEFGNNYYNFENKFRRYNTKVISEDFAKFAFKAYRMLEESEQARIMEYGSDTTIAAIYDMVIKNGYVNTDNIGHLEETMHQASDLLDRELGYKKEQFEEQFRDANSVNYMLNIVKLRGRSYYEL